MNSLNRLTSSILVAFVAMVGAAAQADSNNNYPVAPKTKSTTTRAEVKAEALSARRTGDAIRNDESYPPSKTSTGTGKTRAQVKAEVKEQKVNGRISDNAYPAK